MSYRTDKFQVGDKVTWASDHHATITDGRKSYGEGPFVVSEVFDRPFYHYMGDRSNWDDMGHTQHIKFDGNEYSLWSGAYFKKVEE